MSSYFNKVKRLISILIISGAVMLNMMLGIQQAHADNFGFTPQEFASLDHYCKSVLASLRSNVSAGYGYYVPRNLRRKVLDEGERDGGSWHYCRGLLNYRRGEIAVKPSQKYDFYDHARKDMLYSYNSMEKNRPRAPVFATNIAKTYRKLGQKKNEMRFLNNALKLFPDYADLYTEYGLLYYFDNDFKNAKEKLLKANELHNGKSSEVIYFLGLTSLEAGSIAEAKKYAKQANDMGYPLKGLSERIARYEQNKE